MAALYQLNPPPAATLEWVRRMLGARTVLGIRPLVGGGWHVNHVVTLAAPSGGRVRVVLRRWARPGWDLEDPDFNAEREATVLQRVARAHVPAPRLLAADLAGTEADVPALVETFAAGHPIARPGDVGSFVRGLAATLAMIHALPADPVADRAIEYRRFYEPANLRPPSWARSTEVWDRAIETIAEPALASATGFIHRDYHPGNVLWAGVPPDEGRDRAVTAVVDWTSASNGPFAVDIGHLRFNLVASLGPAVADALLDEARRTGSAVDYSPEWDIRATLDVLPEITGRRESQAELRRLEAHVARALAELGR